MQKSMVVFSIEGKPVPKGRPRFARRGNFVQTYTDSKTLSYEQIVAMESKKAMGSSEAFKNAISLYLYIRLPVPKSYTKKATADCLSGLVRPTKKSDIDNFTKSLMDGMNGVVYLDDSQVVDLHVRKIYSSVPGVDICVMEEHEIPA